MQEFTALLEYASERVPQDYFQLPIDGQEDPIYRERVYCYELYHQLRILWPEHSVHSLAGEVDKAGHPLVRGNGLDGCKPDFLVHIPGDMGGNYAVIEVKPIRASSNAIKKDINTLSSFLMYAQYERAIYLFYGNTKHGNGVDVALRALKIPAHPIIEIWHHEAAGQQAKRLL